MLKLRDGAPKKRKPANKINTSSRTRTPRNKRRKNRAKLTRSQVEKDIEVMSRNDELLLNKVFEKQELVDVVNLHCKQGIKRRKRIYDPATTMSLFVQQVLTKDSSCLEMVSELNVRRKKAGLGPASTHTAGYCEARARIPLAAIKQLTKQTADLATQALSGNWLWHGHRVFLVDGLVIDGPDTPENQKTYPQPSSQKPGLGFPQIRLCASICMITGAVTDVRYSPVSGKNHGEQTLFRQMFGSFAQGDIVVGDSNFESYREMATLFQQGVSMVCEINGSRTSPFTGKCQGIEETIEIWPRPGFDKSRFTRHQWDQLPKTLMVRVIRFPVKGRDAEKTIVTTLLDTDKYPAEAVIDLYSQRWECELDIRCVKTVMGMTHLSCHTPAMLERELMTYFLAYNLIRVVMADAAKLRQMKPRDLSFKQAKISWLKFGQDLDTNSDISWLLWLIVSTPLKKRPGRREPRKIKRRSNKYPKLTRPRALEKADLAT